MATFKWHQYTGNAYSGGDTGAKAYDSTSINELAFKRTDATGLVSSGGEYALGTDAATKAYSWALALRPVFNSSAGTFPLTVQNQKFWLFENADGQSGSVAHTNTRPDGGYGYDTGAVTVRATTEFVAKSDAPTHYYNASSGAMASYSALAFETQRSNYPASGGFDMGSNTYSFASGNTYAAGPFIWLQVVIDSASHSLGRGGQSLFVIQYDIAE